jgi:hypothetical protein
MDKKLFKIFEKILTEKKKWLKDIKVKPGKMHRLLGIKENELIKDHYTSGEKLAKDLLKSLNGDKKKASGMLSFAANANKEDDIFDVALRSLKNLS